LKITLLGTGTSQGIPIILCKCKVCSSIDPRDKRLRCSALFQDGEESILIDTSPDFRQQMHSNKIEKISAILYTHEHNDHTTGLDDVRPFNFNQKEALNVFGLRRVLEDLKRKFAYIFESNPYPGAPKVILNYIDADKNFKVNGIEILPLPISHGNLAILGYRIKNIAYLTDVSLIPDSTFDLLKGVEVIIISALRNEPHKSHFSLKEAIEAIGRIGPKRSYLIHLSHDFPCHGELEKTLPQNVFLAYDGLVIHA
jgi:phosphoribosyl 1,2-cyclic phosphate phosphodiesterase